MSTLNDGVTGLESILDKMQASTREVREVSKEPCPFKGHAEFAEDIRLATFRTKQAALVQIKSATSAEEYGIDKNNPRSSDKSPIVHSRHQILCHLLQAGVTVLKQFSAEDKPAAEIGRPPRDDHSRNVPTKCGMT